MQEERMQVLKMIEDGKITVDEATKLLDALKTSSHEYSPGFEEKFNKFSAESKEFFKEMGVKIGEMCEKARPKIESATKTVAAKTADIADNIAQSLNEKIAKMEEKCDCSDGCCGEHHPADNGSKPE